MRLAAACAAPALLAASPSPGYHYVLDAPHSDINAKVAFFGLSSKTAHFPSADGAILLSPGEPDAVDLDVTLDARALTASDQITLGRLKSDKFFDVAHFPQVRFSGHHLVMTGERTARLEGMLTARGVTRPVALDVRFSAPPTSASAHAPIRLNASMAINRDDFGMTAYHFIVGRSVTITIDATMVPA